MISNIQSVSGFTSSLPPAWSEILDASLEDMGLNGLNSLEELKLVKELDCSRSDIENLYPLRMFPNLEVLDISGTNVKDVTSIMYLANLREFNACFCHPFDLDILITLPNLEVLDLSYPKAPFLKFDALSDLEQLKEGYFNACSLDTVAHFMTMNRVKTLSLPFNPIPREEIYAYRELNPDCKVIY
ncbi:MAG: hypothetical protein MRZ79_01515 [Bacteroidia bacterium]|nr:hypothetical protein [Bacteroidia bacterium]